ncbi:hypothetical protein VPH35_114220 [Triticum aestivum]
MEGNQLAAIQEEEGEERGAGQTEEYQEAEVPDLALNLQVMNISAPRVHNLRATQPWTMGSDNLLIEWIDPADESKTKDDYKFDHIYVSVRVYGVPKNHRSLQLLQQILSTVGKPSEFHPLQESMLFASRSDYIWGTTKIRISDSTVDKISLTLDEKNSKTVYLYYEKVGRICLFCGVMFHTVQHCQKRNNIIMERVRRGQSTDMAIEKEIATNPILSRFQKMFQEDQNKERGKQVLGKTDLHPSFPTRQYYYGSTENERTQLPTIHNHPIQNLYTRERQVKGTGGAEMHRTTSFNNSGIHDYEMEDLPENVQYGQKLGHK